MKALEAITLTNKSRRDMVRERVRKWEEETLPLIVEKIKAEANAGNLEVKLPVNLVGWEINQLLDMGYQVINYDTVSWERAGRVENVYSTRCP